MRNATRNDLHRMKLQKPSLVRKLSTYEHHGLGPELDTIATFEGQRWEARETLAELVERGKVNGTNRQRARNAVKALINDRFFGPNDRHEFITQLQEQIETGNSHHCLQLALALETVHQLEIRTRQAYQALDDRRISKSAVDRLAKLEQKTMQPPPVEVSPLDLSHLELPPFDLSRLPTRLEADQRTPDARPQQSSYSTHEPKQNQSG